MPTQGRQIWITALTQEGIAGATLAEVVASAVAKLEALAAFRPDIVCLPETFHTAGLTGARPDPGAAAETPPGPLTAPLADFARRHHCYVVCPIYTVAAGRVYNAAVLLDRQGRVAGEYRKIHPTETEIAEGIWPGPEEPPVFDTDFGRIGIQICFDIQWGEAWRRLAAKGAELVFWPSAFAGGQLLNGRARENQYCVVSSTQKDAVKLCDLTGEELGRSGRWQPWGLSLPLNLERALVHTWPYVERFGELQAKYGRRLRLHSLHEEEMTLVESLEPDLRVHEVLREFGIPTHRQHLTNAERAQQACK